MTVRKEQQVEETHEEEEEKGEQETGDVATVQWPSVLKNYRLLSKICRENNYDMFLVEHKTKGKEFAMKVFMKDLVVENDEIEIVKNELEVLRKIYHPFLSCLEEF